MASGVNGGSSNCLAGLCSGGSEVIGGADAGDLGPDVAHDDAARGKMLGVVGDLLHRLIGGRQVAAEETLGVNDRAFGSQFVPDRKRIFGPARIGMVEIVNPVGDRGCSGMMLAESDIRHFLFVGSLESNLAPAELLRSEGSFLGHFDRDFRTIGLGKPRLVLESRRARSRRRSHAHCRIRRDRTARAPAICSGRVPDTCPGRRAPSISGDFDIRPCSLGTRHRLATSRSQAVGRASLLLRIIGMTII